MKRKGKFYAYIVECEDGTYYTGYTPNLKKRIALHNVGKGAKYTRGRLPVKLIWSDEYGNSRDALRKEIAVKKMTRGQKEKLVSVYNWE